MARLARVEVFSPDEIAIVHVMNRVARRRFLLVDDPVTGKNYDHRKAWIEELLRRQAAFFGIDLPGFAILSKHFPLILRSRPDVVATRDDSEVARRLPPRGDPVREGAATPGRARRRGSCRDAHGAPSPAQQATANRHWSLFRANIPSVRRRDFLG